MKARLRLGLGVGLGPLMLPAAAAAHERFVKHELKQHLQDGFFQQQAGKPFGMDPNMIQVGLLVTLVLAAFFVFFFLREGLDEFIRYKILAPLRGAVQRTVHNVACFVMDKPVRSKWFYAAGEWSVIMFLRSPALVLMYSATNDSLVMPSYPLEPSSAVIFKFIQVLLAILILTQTLLPLCGALVIGTWFYTFRWGPFVAIDAIPIVTAGILYAMSPWQSHKLAITRLNAQQTRVIRFVFGLGFVALGWAKIYNHDLTVGVADNYPWIMNDPMVGFFKMGTDPAFQRETWVLSFALAEVMSGFMIMMGIFTRLWGTIMIVMFTKLTLVDFGWDEIPHIYPIGAALAVVTSNHLHSEFGLVEKIERALRSDAPAKRFTLVAVSATVIAFLAVMPVLYFLTFTNRSLLR
ncbi:MAG: hypothetical protein A3H97_06985 [Acidobacteria bacterium RIFCSPLOWO2_02_FULL_65_29]|nr:MAG: hypothetical protein A3H97_06985 [Acidobacteria bacterium RIFCSPLOWO2_02_FULL_65_29]